MKNQYHILNGQALKEQFPTTILGETIVTHECLADGNVEGNNLKELFATRAKFISETYQACTEQEYFDKTVPEFQKIQDISKEVEINLWFEDDLFCQVNFWFVIHLLQHYQKSNPIFLVRPSTHTQYGFAGFNQEGLVGLYKNRLPLKEMEKLKKLWPAYQNISADLLKVAKELENTYPFILVAVEAYLDSIPQVLNLGRPRNTLIQIIKDLKTKEFGPVFQEFSKRESIYGFGDLQVKRLFEEVKSSV